MLKLFHTNYLYKTNFKNVLYTTINLSKYLNISMKKLLLLFLLCSVIINAQAQGASIISTNRPTYKIGDTIQLRGNGIKTLQLKSFASRDSFVVNTFISKLLSNTDTLYNFIVPNTVKNDVYLINAFSYTSQLSDSIRLVRFFVIPSNIDSLGVIGWGRNDDGQTNIPAGLKNVIQVAGGRFHSLALKADGTVVAWGNNDYGQAPISAGLNYVVQVAAGAYHSLALKADGNVVAWGLDGNGQTSIPAGLNNVVQVAGGLYHSIALNADGTVVAWGNNDNGQASIPAGLNNVVQVAAGAYHSLALKADGTLVAWGNNDYGQAPISTGLNNVVQIAGGDFHSLALKADGNVVAWGLNGNGQTSITAGLNNVVKITSGDSYSLALKADGNVVAWGSDGNGQTSIPAGLNNVVQIAGGYYHSLAIAKLYVNTTTNIGDTITPTTFVKNGDSLRITFQPNIGYFIDSIFINGVLNIDSLTGYTFKNITQFQNVRVVYKLLTFSITSSAGNGGSISPQDTTIINYGTKLQYTITPNIGYIVDTLFVNGNRVDSTTSYTFDSVKSNQTIVVKFKPITAPGKPLNVFAVEGDSKAIIHFVSPIYNGGVPINKYIVEEIGGNYKDSGATSPITITGLTNLQTYQFSVKAVNSYGLVSDTSLSNLIQPVEMKLVKTIVINGIISKDTTISIGGSREITYSPNEGYTLDSIIVNGVYSNQITMDSINRFTFKNIYGDSTIKLVYKLQTFTIISSAGEGGSISPQDTTIIYYGTKVQYTITPNRGYVVDTLFVNGNRVDSTTSYTFDSVKADQTISVKFKVQTFSITSTAGIGGGISPQGISTLNYGSKSIYTILPNTGYILDSLFVNGLKVDSISSYTFDSVKSDQTISVKFKVQTFTITSSAGIGGGISPQGINTFNYGSKPSYTILPNTGYILDTLFVNGLKVDSITSYTFDSIKSDQTISVKFKVQTFTITSSAGEGGRISPQGINTFNYGSKPIYTISPNTGYILDSLFVNGLKVDSTTSYTFDSVKSDQTISVKFKVQTFTITSSAGDGGSISPQGTTLVNYGGNHAYSITPNIGFVIDTIFVNGVKVDSISSYTFDSVKAYQTISVKFKVQIFTITSSAGIGGGISPQGINTFNYGSKPSYTILPNTGYVLDSLFVNGLKVDSISSYTFDSVKSDQTISVKFKVLTFSITSSAGNGGSISSQDTTIINYGTKLQYTITPNIGYIVDTLFVNGNRVDSTTSYTFDSVKSNQTIVVKFKPITAPGKPLNVIAVEGDSKAIIHFVSPIYNGGVPINKYIVEEIGGNYKDSGATSPITITGLTNLQTYQFSVKAVNSYGLVSDTSLSNLIQPVEMKLVKTIVINGIISKDTTISIGGSREITYSPNEGYTLDSIIVNGVYSNQITMDSINRFTFKNIYGDSTIKLVYKLQTFTIISSAGEGGSISPQDTTIIYYGTKVQYTITPNRGYVVDTLFVNGNRVDSTTSYTFDTVKADQTISVKFKVQTFSITSTAGIGGGISPQGISTLNYGSKSIYTILPNTGYILDSLFVNGLKVDSISSYTFDSVKSDQTISVKFKVQTFTITSSAGIGGGISPQGINTFNYGSKPSYTILPNTGYILDTLFVNGLKVDSITSYTFDSIKSDQTISVKFKVQTFTITSSAGEGGRISPQGINTFNYGSKPIYTISPNTGYILDSLFVNGLKVDSTTSYTFDSVKSDQTISVKFKVQTFTITSSAGDGGSISPQGTTLVNYGGNHAYLITPNIGFVIDTIFVNGVKVDSISSYTFDSVKAYQTISVKFKVQIFTITSSAGIGGGITPQGINTFNYGSKPSYTILPNTGYVLDSLFVNGLKVDSTTSYTFDSVKADQTISVKFKVQTFTITSSAGNGGSISPQDTTIINYGTKVLYTITSNIGYIVDTLFVNGNRVDSTTSYTFDSVKSNQTIVVKFKPITAPGKPLNVIAVEGDSKAIIHFVSPIYNGGVPINKYIVEEIGGNYKDSGATSPITITGLTNLQTYQFSVKAVNSYGLVSDTSLSNLIQPVEMKLVKTIVINGIISKDTTISIGGSREITYSPNEGYTLDSIIVNGVYSNQITMDSINRFTFKNIYGDSTIKLVYKLQTFTIISSAGEGGSISPQDTTIIYYGTKVQYTITPNRGYVVDTLFINGNRVDSTTSYTFDTVKADQTISVKFKVQTFSITSTAGIGGGISPQGINIFNYGSKPSYTILPNTGYILDSLFVNGLKVDSISSYTFDSVKSDQTISVKFKVQTFTITSSAGIGGGISPQGINTFNYGSKPSYTILPNTGYILDSLFVNGLKVDSITSYTFDSVKSDQTISVKFKVLTFSITSSAEIGGSISPQGINTFNYGSKPSYTILPNTGYVLDSLFVNGIKVDSISSYTFDSIKSDQTISVKFKVQTFTITSSAGNGGSISPQDTTIINYGTKLQYTITPNIGYIVDTLFVNGNRVDSITSYTIDSVKSNQTIVVKFKPITAPSKPLNVFAVEGDSKAIIHFVSPIYNGGVPINKYIVEEIGGNYKDSGATSPITITGLTNLQTYQFSVKAVNSYGLVSDTSLSNLIQPVEMKLVKTIVINGIISKDTTISIGGSREITYSPNEGYTLDSIIVNGVYSNQITMDSINRFTFKNIYGDSTIKLVYKLQTFTIISSAGEGGSISPQDTTIINYGTKVQYTITPNTGFVLDSLFVNGVKVDSITSYTFDSIKSDQTISVKFKVQKFSITSTAGIGGGISPQGINNVNYGANASYTFTPNTGYVIDSVIVNGVKINNVNNYTFNIVTGDSSIRVTFKLQTFTIISSAGNGGIISPQDTNNVNYGAKASYTFTPNTGYFIDSVFINGVLNIDSLTGYTFNNITQSQTMRVVFTPITAPSKPRNVIAIAGNKKIILRFLSPTNFGSKSIVKYIAKVLDTNIKDSSTTTAITLTGLTIGQTYNITVQAVNNEGLISDTTLVSNIVPINGTEIISTHRPTYKIGDTIQLRGNGIKTLKLKSFASRDSFEITNFITKIPISSDTNYTFIVPNTVKNELYIINAFSYTNQLSDSIRLVRFFVIPRNIDSFGVVAWGDNSDRQTSIPTSLNNVVQIAGGGYHSLALKADGTVVAWGNNQYGQTTIPDGLNNVVQIAAGYVHSFALKADGTVVAWGSNLSGQTNIPAGINNVVQIAVGGSHNIVLKVDGTVDAWGINWAGQTSIPAGLNNVVQIAGGFSHSMALKIDGTVVAWGDNFFKQTTIPVGINNVTQIALAYRDNIAIKADSTLVAWGYNGYGETNIPDGLNNVVQVAGGEYHFLALKANGTVVEWGVNGYGLPIIPAELNNVIQIAGGYNHNLAITKLYVNTTSNSGGTISPTTFVKNGDSLRITFQPNIGYFIDSIFINGVLNIDSLTGYTFKNITQFQNVRVVYKLQTFTITSSAGNGGGISPQGINTLNYGSKSIYTITPNRGFLIDSLLINGLKVDSISSYTFDSVKADQTISVKFKVQTFTITSSAEIGGGISPQGISILNYGTKPIYTISPNTGYILDSLFVNGLKVDSITSYTFDSIKSDQTISVKFKLLTFSITSSAEIDGSISPQGISSVNYVTKLKYTITPNIGYVVDTLFVNGNRVDSTTSYTFDSVKSDQTISVKFKVQTFTITSSAGNGGSISPQGINTLNYGAKPIYTITPNRGFVIDSLLINGLKVDSISSYTFDSVKADQTISVKFKVQTFTITSSAEIGGGISPQGISILNYGNKPIYTISPNTGYILDSLFVNGLKVDSITSYTFDSIKSDQTISVKFKLLTFSITASAEIDGSISPQGISSVNYVTKLQYTIMPNIGYVVDTLFVNGNRVDSTTSYTFDSVKSDQTISVKFKVQTFTITSSAGNSGSISPQGINTLNYGSKSIYTITPNTGFVIDSLLINGLKVDSISSYTFDSLKSDQTIRATFKIKSYIISTNRSTYKIGDTIQLHGNGIKSLKLKSFANRDSIVINTFISKLLSNTDTLYSFIVPNTVKNDVYLINAFSYTDQLSNSQRLVRFFVIPNNIDSLGVIGWGGDNGDGQTNIPATLNNVMQVAGGYYHSLALKGDGTLVAWGRNNFGQTNIPAGLNNVVQISGGRFHGLALKANGTVVAWGENYYEQTSIPAGLNNVVQVAGGSFHSLALKSDGTVVAWGANFYGQLNIPAGLNNVVQIAAGFYYSFALKADGTVVAWGEDEYKQTSIQPAGLKNVVQIASGKSHILALKADGTVVAWGSNGSGQTSIPAGLNNVVQIASGDSYSLALKFDGTVVAWGYNVGGQATIPTGLYNVVQIVGGYFHSLAIAKLYVNTTTNIGGTITPTTFVKYGDILRITYQPNNGYFIDSIFINGVLNTDSLTGYTFKNITQFQNVRVVYKIQTFIISSSAGNGGSISPQGTNTLNYGTKPTYIITPNTGFVLDSLFVNGLKVDSISSYTFDSVKSNQTILVKFKQITPPSKPLHVLAISGNEQAIIRFESPLNNGGVSISKYIVEVVGENIKDSSIRSPIIITGLTNFQTYQFSVKAINNFGLESDTSLSNSIQPDSNLRFIKSSAINGKITADTTVSLGEFRIISYSPKEGFTLDSIFINGIYSNEITRDSINRYTFKNINGDSIIKVVYKLKQFNIIASAGMGGSISPQGISSVYYGSKPIYTITPNRGFVLDSLFVNDVKVDSISSYTFDSVKSNQTISVKFKVQTFTITSSAGNGGSITPQGISTLNYGSKPIYTITPNRGFVIDTVFVNGLKVDSISNYTFDSVKANQTISVKFKIQSFSITSSAEMGGSISPQGISTLNYGSKPIYTITPNRGFVIDTVFVNGLKVDSISNYTFDSVKANQTISVKFKVQTFTITSSAGNGGSISPQGINTLNYGSKSIYTITPNTGYILDSLFVNGLKVDSISSYTFDSVKFNQTISVKFKVQTFTITSSAEIGGGISPQGISILNYGTKPIYTISPNTGYVLDSLFVNGLKVDSITSYTFDSIKSDQTISVKFKILTFSITSSAEIDGSISPQGISSVNYVTKLQYTITPNIGYVVDTLFVNGNRVDSTTSYTFDSVKSDQTISVKFKVQTFTITATAGNGGSISPQGTNTLNYGAKPIYTITPNRGFVLDSLLINGLKVDSISSYTFDSVKANQTILVKFKVQTFTLTSSAENGGSISPQGTNTLNYGAKPIYTITPNRGFVIDSLFVNDVKIDSISSYTFDSVKANQTISVKFKVQTFTLTSSAGNGGSINPQGTSTFNYGTKPSYIITPNRGFVIDSLFVNDLKVDSITSYTFDSVKSNQTISVKFKVQTFTLTSSAGNGGSISPQGTSTFNYGTKPSYIITPNRGYVIDSLFVNDVKVDSITSYTFDSVKLDQTISVKFKVQTFTITATAGNGGSISPQGTSTFNYGTKPSYIITPNWGYVIDSLFVNDVKVDSITSYTFDSVKSNQTISVKFKVQTFSITSSAGNGGSISPQGTNTLNYGTKPSYIITPNRGFVLDSLFVNDVKVDSISSYTFDSVKSNQTISVKFKVQTFTLTSSAGNGGSISPQGINSLNYGAKPTYTITPNRGFVLDSLFVNGLKVDSITSYTFDSVKSDQTISVKFKVQTFTITATAGNGGSISPQGTSTFNYGTKPSYIITPNRGFVLDSLFVNDVNVDSISSYTFDSVKTNQTISVKFKVQTFTITATAGNGGSINPQGISTLNYGSKPTYTITPNRGFVIDSLFVNDVNVDSISSYTFDSVKANQTISVKFKVQTFTITATAGNGGSISPQDTTIINYGTKVQYTITSNIGYIVDTLFVNGNRVDSTTSYTFDSVKANQTISVKFKVQTFTIISSAGNGGSISPLGASTFNYGTKPIYTILPNTGFILDSLFVNDVNVDSISSYTFDSVKANQTILVKFKQITPPSKPLHVLAISGNEQAIIRFESPLNNGGVSISKYIVEVVGENIKDSSIRSPIIITGLTNFQTYKFSVKAINNFGLESDTSLSNSIQPDNNLRIIKSSVINGKITADTTVSLGEFRIISYSPKEGFTLDSIFINGIYSNEITRDSINRFTFKNINGDSIIKVVYKLKQFNIIASAGMDGSISPQGISSVYYGTKPIYTITPNTGFILDSLFVNGLKVDSITSYTFDSVKANQTISVKFKVQTFSITSSAVNGGGITPQGTNTLNYGAKPIYTITPNTGYILDSLFVNGLNVDSISSYTFDSVKSNQTISVKFKQITPPSKPLHVLAISGNEQAIIRFESPLNNGGVSISKYIVEVVGENIKDSSIRSPIIITGLTNFQTYQFSVKAINNFGLESDTSLSNSIQPDNNLRFIKSSVINGKITADTTVSLGEFRIISYSPKEGFTLDSIFINGIYSNEITRDSINRYTFKNINGDSIIKVVYKLKQFNIIASAGMDGSVSPQGISSVYYGTKPSYTITPNRGFILDSLFVNGLKVDSITSYTFDSVKSNQTISAKFKVQTFTITSSAGEGGSISSQGTSTLNYGSKTTYTITPNRGFVLDSLFVNDVKVDSISSYTFDSVKSNQTISAIFKVQTFTITSSAGNGGSITPQGINTLNYGTKPIYTITPNTGFILDSLFVNGLKVDSITSYTFDSVKSNQTISVIFKVQTFTITASAGDGGSISPQGISTINYGAKPSYTISPNIGYVLDSLLINGLKVDSISSYTFDSVKSDQTISVKFKLQTFTIISIAGTGGSISPQGTNRVNYGANAIYTFTPNTEYVIDSVIVNGVKVDSTTSYTFNNISANQTIQVIFKLALVCPQTKLSPNIVRVGSELKSDITTFAKQRWYLAGTIKDSTTNNTYTPTDAGVYTLLGIDSIGCESNLSKKYYYSRSCIISTGRLGNGANIQANIVGNANLIIIKWCTDLIKENITIQLLDLSGAKVYEQEVPYNLGSMILNKSNITSKNYYIQVLDSKGEIMQISDLIKN